MANEDYIAVIAIDFGTTFSGYAFSMRGNKNDIIMNKNWGADVGFRGYKTPTTVLLRPDGSTHAFGFHAENEFGEMDEDEREKGYLLFQRFKMELFAHKTLNSDITIKSTTGEERRAVDIIAKALAFMKKHCLEAISKSLESDIAEEYIRWVLTVPAIWSDTAKKFMRLAAKNAGLVKDILSQNLIIALEPEAASLYCRTLASDKFLGMRGTKGETTMKPGEKYIIIDCGGGTIDITAHEVLKKEKSTDCKEASGGPWGGIYVDQKYFQLLDEIFGADFMNTLKCYHPSAWLGMLVDFETRKRAAKPENTTGINVNITHQFAKQFEKHSKEDLEERIKKKKHLGVKFSNGLLKISGETVPNLYSGVIPKIRSHLEQLLSESNGVNVSKMFVVGGFGESAYLQEFLKSEFASKMKILIPEEAGMCVLKGAVLYGHDTQVITSRIARFNYGVPMLKLFDRDEHDPSRMQIIDGDERVFCFNRKVKRGQRIRIDDVVENTCHIIDPNQIAAYVSLCSTMNDETDDPDHESVTVLEEIVLDSPNPKNKDRAIRYSLRFGGTDILLSAIDVDSGNEAHTTVQF